MRWFVYILECADGSFYTGITTDVVRRVWQHSNKKGAKSLYGKLPLRLVFIERHIDKISAAKREREIKGWNRKKKALLVGFTLRNEVTKGR